MQVLTIALFAYVGFVAFDFGYGLWQLWQASARQVKKSPPEISLSTEDVAIGTPAHVNFSQSEISLPQESGFQPTIADPWEDEIETPLIKGEQEPEPKPQLLLAPAKDDLSRLTVAELRRKAQSLKIRGARAMKKADLLMALS